MLTWILAKKDLRLLLRDPRAMVVLLAMPLIFILVLGVSLGEGFGQKPDDRLRVSIVDLDTGFADPEASGAGATYRAGHFNFLAEAIRLLYFGGRENEAAYYYEYLRQAYGKLEDGRPNPALDKPLRDFLGVARFLRAELVAGEAKHGEALAAIFLL